MTKVDGGGEQFIEPSPISAAPSSRRDEAMLVCSDLIAWQSRKGSRVEQPWKFRTNRARCRVVERILDASIPRSPTFATLPGSFKQRDTVEERKILLQCPFAYRSQTLTYVCQGRDGARPTESPADHAYVASRSHQGGEMLGPAETPQPSITTSQTRSRWPVISWPNPFLHRGPINPPQSATELPASRYEHHLFASPQHSQHLDTPHLRSPTPCTS